MPGQSFQSNIFFKKNINNNNNDNCYFFFHFSSLQGLLIQPCGSLNPRAVRIDLGGRVSTQHASLLVGRSGLQTLPRMFAHPLALGCSQARGSAPSTQDWADPAPSVCLLGPQPALAPGGCSLRSGQTRVACPNARCPQPQEVCLQPGAWGLQGTASPCPHQTLQIQSENTHSLQYPRYSA